MASWACWWLEDGTAAGDRGPRAGYLGRAKEGMWRLDEAAAAALGGEFEGLWGLVGLAAI